MWSLGISAYILLTGEHPFWDKRTSFVDSEMHARIQVKPADVSVIQPESAADFVSKLLRVDVKTRLSAHEALTHPCMRVSAFLGSEPHLKLMTNLRSYKSFRPIQKVVLTIMAYHAKDELLREVFNLLDTDMNGVLSKQEIAKGMKKLGLILPSDFDEVVASIDADGSGEIDFTEFVAAGLSGDQVLTQSLIDCAFGWLSSEQPDVISLEDLEHVVSAQEARFTLQQYSRDESGLTRADFTKLVVDIAKIKKCNESPTSRAKRRSSWDNHTCPIHNPFRTLSDH
jgi:calcium-dependent protein kinase